MDWNIPMLWENLVFYEVISYEFMFDVFFFFFLKKVTMKVLTVLNLTVTVSPDLVST